MTRQKLVCAILGSVLGCCVSARAQESIAGTLDLLNRTGANVAELKFAGASTLYATADGGGGMDITTAHHIGSLPTIFVH